MHFLWYTYVYEINLVCEENKMNKFYEFMRGRYGADELCAVCVIFSLILQIILSLFDVWWLSLLPLIPIGWTLFRIFSRNIAARRRENEIIKKIGEFYKLCKNKWRDRKTHVYRKCHACGAVLRLPKAKGSHFVVCPRCKNRFEVKG